MVCGKQFKCCRFAFLILFLIAHTECGRSGGGSRSSGSSGSRSSSHTTSHSNPSHSGGSSHSSFGSNSHSSFGGGSHSSGSGFHPSSGSGIHSSSGGGGGFHIPSGSGSHSPIGGTSHSSHPSPPISSSGPSAPHLPGYTVTGGAGFIPHSSGGTKPIGFDNVNQQAHNSKPLGPPASTGGIGFEHQQQSHSTGLNSAKPPLPPTSGGTGIPQHPNPVLSGPPGYAVTGGTPFPNKPSGGIGFDNVNQQAHSTQLNNAKPFAPPVTGGIQQHSNPVYSGPPGYTVTGGAPLPNKPNAIGFDHVNQQAHGTQLNQQHGVAPPVSGGFTSPRPGNAIGFDHVNQQAYGGINPVKPVTPPSSVGGIIPQHSNPVHAGTGFAPNAPPSQTNYPVNTGTRAGIGFDHVNQQAAGAHYNTPTYQPYRPQTIVQPSGYVHYQPPVQLQYTPPVTIHHTTTHIVPVYQPSVIHTHSSGDSLLSHGGSFLGGYLIGRLTSPDYGHYHSHSAYQNTHITNNYYNNDRTDNYYSGPTPGGGGGNSYNSYYTVHHYHQNREQIPPKFSIPGEDLTQCQGNTTNLLCVPNTNAFCLKNGTIMCTTPTILTTPCGQNTTDRCVYSRIDCNGNPACNITANQTYIDFYLPCISNVTYVDNKVLDSTAYKTQGSYELCVTAIANPRKLESPVAAIGNLFTEFGKWYTEKLNEINNAKGSSRR